MPLCDTGPAFILHSCPIAGGRWAHGVARAHREAHGAVVHAAVRFGSASWVRRPPRWRRWVVCPKNPGRQPFRTGARSLPASPGFPGSSLRPDLLALGWSLVLRDFTVHSGQTWCRTGIHARRSHCTGQVLAILAGVDEVASAGCETTLRVVHVDARARAGELGGMTGGCGGFAWFAPIGLLARIANALPARNRPALARRASSRRPRKALGAGPFGPAPALSQHLPACRGKLVTPRSPSSRRRAPPCSR